MENKMSTLTPQAKSVITMYRWYRNGKLIVNRQYQRKLVWSLKEKKMLIDSVLSGYPIPLILLAEVDRENESYEIIDGIQRLNALFGFIENQFSIEYDGQDVYFDLSHSPFANNLAQKGVFTAQKDVEKLGSEAVSTFLEYQLPITIYHYANRDQVNQIFRRINSHGKHLSGQEVRQAGMTSNFSKIVRELGAELRGDVSQESLPLHDLPEISIDTKSQFGYGVSAEETFWCKHGVINTGQLRESLDEQFIADIILSIIFDTPFAASKESFDRHYGKCSPDKDKSSDVEVAINRYGIDRLKKDVKAVYSQIKDMTDSYLTNKKLKHVLHSKSASNTVKEPFYTLFMAMYELIIKEQKRPTDVPEIFASLNDLNSRITVGRRNITNKARRQNIDVCKGLISNYFERSDEEIVPGTLAIELENHLRRSKIEAPTYDFKQGFYNLHPDPNKRQFNNKLFEKIMRTIAALANLGKNKKGHLFIGVTDCEKDTQQVEKLDNLTSVPRINDFGIVGLEREAKLENQSLDKYISYITQQIRHSKLPNWLKTQVNARITPITYHMKYTVLMIEVAAGDEPVWYKNDLWIRSGTSCIKVEGSDINSVFKLFA